MRNRSSYSRDVKLKSYCDGIVVRGSAKQIQIRWENLGDEAEKAGDHVMAQRFKQQAEHFLKLS